MSNYDIAWVVIVIFGLLGAFGLYRLLPNLRMLIRLPLVAVVLALFLAPAAVPRFEGEFAPAFVVFIFELLFQIDGEPGPAGLILVIAVIIGLLLGIGTAYKLDLSNQAREAPQDSNES